MKPELNKEIIRKRIAKKQKLEKIEESESKKFVVLHILWLLLVIFFVFSGAIYVVYLQDLPSIKTISDNVMPESTTIYDRNGNELYNLYSKEKRTYVDYSKISTPMKEAIISIEDKTFFQNKGFDFKGLLRAGLNYITGKSDKIQGTSTISQQLIKVSFLTNERSLKRKIQELYLSYQLNTNYSKENILEMYLNKISFGSNAYGIEEASKTFFGKNAKDLGIMESSILASIPKGPTYYSPYNHRDRLMGYVYVYKEDTPKDIIRVAETENPAFYNPLLNKFKSIITDMDMKESSPGKMKICKLDKEFFKKDTVDADGCAQVDASKITDLLNNIRIPYSSLKIEKPNEDLTGYILEYNVGRKDLVLTRMLEDQKIKVADYKNCIVSSFDFKFRKYVENIKYPHFVFYVKEYLEDKYGKEFGSQGGLNIYTTIDPKLQDKAEELVKKQVDINKTKYGASNAALVSVDNRNGQIIAMVGGVDYFDALKGSNVNIITAQRQPGSSFKPIVYLNAISKKPIGPETPVYDSEAKFGKWDPNNYDGKFMGLMPLRKALDYSRNIPAIKVFFFGGGEDAVVKFANELGIASLQPGAGYGGPLSIGAGEVKPLEMAQAYSVFANYGRKKELTPIIRIEDKKGNLIDAPRKTEGVQVVSQAACYILSKILSDATSRPNAFWNNVLTLKDRPVAAKTGTSNKDVSKGKKKEILPGDLWTAGYTPQITTVVWAGNTDGSPTKGTCDGLNCAAPIWHDFMEFAHKGLEKEQFKEPEGVIKATISKSSGKLASKSTPAGLKVSSIFAVKPYEYDGGYKGTQVDSLCNGLVTDNTPPEAIKTVYLGSSASPLIDSFNKDWLKSIGKYASIGNDGGGGAEGDGVISDKPCERPSKEMFGISISSTLKNGEDYGAGKLPIEIRFDSNNPVIKLIIIIDGTPVKTIPVKEQPSGNVKDSIDITGEGPHNVTIQAVDKYYFDFRVSYNINDGDTAPAPDASTGSETSTGNEQPSNVEPTPIQNQGSIPKITTSNPPEGDSTLNLYSDQTANVRGSIQSSSDLKSVNVYLNGKFYKELGTSSDFVVPINEAQDLDVGIYSIKIEAIDLSGKKGIKILELKILSR